MSTYWYLCSKETKSCVRVGQGDSNNMSVFYSGETEIMEYLKRFLNDEQGNNLTLLNEHNVFDIYEILID